MKHYTIPFFIPHKGCPFQCVFCDQNNITGQKSIKPDEVSGKIDLYLSTIDPRNADIEVGFFGGTFTGIDQKDQLAFLGPVQKYVKKGIIKGIRLSTRPDFIDKRKLSFLKDQSVKCIELGVQSISDRVLQASKRGYTSKDVKRASSMIKDLGFVLGHQMMLGLPLSDWADEYLTAKTAKDLGVQEVRIYPTLVIKNTELADRWVNKQYVPLSEAEAVERSAKLILYFGSNGIKVIKCGLHPSEGLLSGEDMLDGPFHTAFGFKVESRVFSFMLKYIQNNIVAGNRENSFLLYNPKDEAALLGFEKENVPLISDICRKENLKKNDDAIRGQIELNYSGKSVTVDRNIVAGTIFDP